MSLGAGVGGLAAPPATLFPSAQGRCPSPLDGGDHPIATCCYSSHFSATMTWLLSSCRHREQTPRLPTLAVSWAWFEACQQHWLWLWQWPSSALLPSHGSQWWKALGFLCNHSSFVQWLQKKNQKAGLIPGQWESWSDLEKKGKKEGLWNMKI